MSNSGLIWYAAYGSNLDYDRFLCYIRGGQPSGCYKYIKGCRDTSLPLESQPYIIHNELFFAMDSVSWGGGVAFIKPQKDNRIKTFGRIYLITQHQFEDIVSQENDSDKSSEINYQEAIIHGETNFNHSGWYRKILFIGNSEGFPIFTLTGCFESVMYNQPSAEYLKTIIRGLRQTHLLSDSLIFDYLKSKKGLESELMDDMLNSLVK